MDRTQLLLTVSIALFALGLTGVMIRRNALVMLMCMELMLNGVILSLVTFAAATATLSGAVLVFLVFVVAAPRSPSRSRSCCCCRGSGNRSTSAPTPG